MAGERYLLFVPTAHGYELVEREGELPPVGSETEVDGHAYVVTKIAPSPLPADERRCAYVQRLP